MLGKTLPVVHAAERAPVAVPVDPDAISTTTIDAMVYTGRVSEAIPILEEAVRNAKAVRSQVRLLLTLSGVHGQVGNLEKADVALRHAASALEGDIDSCLGALRLELATAQANILNFRGKTDEGRRRLMRAVAKAASPLSDCERVEHARALAQAQVALANGLMGVDRFAAAIAYASDALSLIQRFELEPVLESRVATELATIRFLSGIPANAALPELQGVLGIAQRNSFVIDIFQSALALALLYSYAGHHEEARRYAIALVQLVRGAGMRGSYLMTTQYILASVQLEAGDFAAARESFRELSAIAARHSPSAFPLAHVIEAQLLAGGRRYRAAVAAIDVAVRQFTAIGSVRLLGTTLRIKAEIEEALGDAHATETIRQSVALLRRGAPAKVASRAYVVSARLTGNQRHRRKATELADFAQLT